MSLSRSTWDSIQTRNCGCTFTLYAHFQVFVAQRWHRLAAMSCNAHAACSILSIASAVILPIPMVLGTKLEGRLDRHQRRWLCCNSCCCRLHVLAFIELKVVFRGNVAKSNAKMHSRSSAVELKALFRGIVANPIAKMHSRLSVVDLKLFFSWN